MITKPVFRTVIAASAAMLLCLSAAADPKNKPGKGKPDSSSVSLSGSAEVSFEVGDHGFVSAGISFGEARDLAVKHEMTGQKPLPPGIRKNLARGKPMPPGIAKTRMPGGFVDQLPRHEGYEWRQAGGDLLLVASASLVISDILEDVFD